MTYKYNLGDILIITEDITHEEPSVKQPYLSKGTKVKVVNKFAYDLHVLVLYSPQHNHNNHKSVFGITQKDFEMGKVIRLSDLREEKLNQLI